MPILPTVGRRSPKILGVIALIYLVLAAGGVTMVYPFLVTLTSAVSNNYDYERFSPFPRYIFHPEERYLKYLAAKYGDDAMFRNFQAEYGLPAYWGSFREIAFEKDAVARFFPLYGCEKDPARWEKVSRRAEDYTAFIEASSSTRSSSEDVFPLFVFDSERDFQRFTRDRFRQIARRSTGSDFDRLSSSRKDSLALQELALRRGESYPSFEYMTLGKYAFAYTLPKWILPYRLQNLDFLDWVISLPPARKIPVTRHFLWTCFLFEAGVDASRYNELTGASIDTIWKAPFPLDEPANPDFAKLRRDFLAENWPVRLTRLKVPQARDRSAFEAYFWEHFPTIHAFNIIHHTDYASLDELPLTATLPALDDDRSLPVDLENEITRLKARRDLWRNYALSRPVSERELLSPEASFQRFLLARYSSAEEIRATYDVADLSQLRLPIPEMDYVDYREHAGGLFRSFLSRNFSRAFFFLAVRGRALANTVILIALTITTTLTVNPLAAYALSRFQLRATNQILVFLLATMAFPPAVSMIPGFLLMRDLGLLNTFFALVLPGAANGFSIFLLKGFFDSLPKELYEAASIDGATEFGMFTTITLPLCKPILAVISLSAFLGAYGGFMWAFLVCQDEKMWTIMVWLYQFQQMYANYPYLIMGALVLASLPTFFIFLTCQKIILRGIIIPSMK
ncbi:MAG: carbohydrate ABC transporter permease [Planctomycetota bacterium]